MLICCYIVAGSQFTAWGYEGCPQGVADLKPLYRGKQSSDYNLDVFRIFRTTRNLRC